MGRRALVFPYIGSIASELLPNLYYRASRDTIYGPDVQEEGSAEHKRMRAVRTKMTIPPAMDDIGAMLAFVEHRSEVKRGVVGCHGYCMSGPLCPRRRCALSRPDRRRCFILRDLARQRG
jgi:hypothetical protein